MTENLYKKLSQERKALQEQGHLPEWFTTSGYQLFLEKYNYGTKTRGSYLEQCQRIAKTAARHTTNPALWYVRFFDILWRGWLSCSTPVLANMGTERGLPVSCSGGHIPDSVDGFYASRREAALLTKYGFGTSGYLGEIRPRGSPFGKDLDNKSTGVLPVLKGFIQDSRDISQGSTRRGAWAGYLEVEHGDFFEVCNYLEAQPDDMNIGWIITDEFINRLNASDEDAISRYQRFMKVKMVTGKGYFFFRDKVNRARPDWYKERDLYVQASNLCVAPETLILTKERGWAEIQDVAGSNVNIWNGEQWSQVVPSKTGEGQKLLRVITSSGQELECTEYHRWYVADGYSGKTIEKRTHELEPGDKLIKHALPKSEVASSKTLWDYYSGFFTGDGCYVGKRQRLYFYGGKRELLEPFKSIMKLYDNGAKITTQDERTYVDGYFDFVKFELPEDDDRFLSWFEGLCDSDGTIARNGTNEALQLGSVNIQMLKEIQLRLQAIGISSKVTKARDAGDYFAPDGRGGEKLYPCQTSYRLLISSSALFDLANMGFSPKRLKFEVRKPQRNAEQFNTVVAVIDDGRIDDTYCFTEPLRGMGMFNGILTGNCNEIRLPSSDTDTFTCVLSSLNLAYYDDWVGTDAVFVATVFLDCVAEEFIQRAKSISGLEKAVNFTKRSRALGLGTCGLHTLYQQKMIPFGSMEAHLLNNSIFSYIREEAERATKWMWEEYYWDREIPEYCNGEERWNSHLLAIAPTKSTALIMGGVSEGINPDFGMAFMQDTAGGQVERVNPTLLKLMKERGVYSKKVVKEVAEEYNGSVQHVDWLSDHEKDVFKTAFEIDQKAILRQAASRQRWIDQGQSLNLFFSADEDEAYISEVHKEAFENENIHGLYYVYSMAGVKAARGECEACT